MRESPEICIRPDALFCLALLLLLMPLKWVTGFLLAAFVHELCHFCALRLVGVAVYRLQIGFRGALMETGPICESQELFCALAGPLGALSLLLVSALAPEAAVCAFFHSIWNLLPVYPLDGGRAVRCAGRILQKRLANRR